MPTSSFGIPTIIGTVWPTFGSTLMIYCAKLAILFYCVWSQLRLNDTQYKSSLFGTIVNYTAGIFFVDWTNFVAIFDGDATPLCTKACPNIGNHFMNKEPLFGLNVHTV